MTLLCIIIKNKSKNTMMETVGINERQSEPEIVRAWSE